ncbi:MAG: NADPH-dependent FMN reductase [Myxococcota bacterium]
MNLLVIVGSLRAAGFSRKLADAVAAAAPEGAQIETTDGGTLPLYNQDLDGDDKPAPVQTLLEQVTTADGLVFVTPEFNYGIPGPVKNLIDWASRPAYNSPLKGKPSLVIAHSIAPSGGARAHAQLASVLVGTLTPVFLAPSFVVPQIHEKFDADGALTDDITRLRLQATLPEFAAWATSQNSA